MQIHTDSDNSISNLLPVLKTIYNSSFIGVEIYNSNGDLVQINDTALEMKGISSIEDAVGNINIFSSPNMDSFTSERIKSGERFSCVLEYDFDIVQKSGFYCTKNSGNKFFEVDLSSLKVEGISGYLLIYKDVTYTVAQAKKLRNVQHNLYLALSSGDIQIWYYDIATMRRKMLDSGKEQSLEHIMSVMHPEDCEIIHSVFDDIIHERIKISPNIVYRMRSASGKYRYYECRMTAKRERDAIVGILGTRHDITDQHLLYQKRSEENKTFNLISRTCKIEKWSYNLASKTIVNYTDSMDIGSGYMTFDDLLKIVHPNDRDKLISLSNAVSRSTMDIVDFEFRIVVKNKINNIAIDGIPYADDDGKVCRYIGLLRNITEWVSVTELLEEQNNTNNLILSNIDVGLLYMSEDCIIKWANPCAKELISKKLGIADSINPGDRCMYFDSGDRSSCAYCFSKDVIEKRVIMHNDIISIIAIPILGDSGSVKGTLFKLADITDNQRLIDDLKFSNKLYEDSNMLLHNIIEKIPMGIFVKDVNSGIYLVTNKNLEFLKNTPNAVICGKTDYELYAKEKADSYKEENLKAINANGSPVITTIFENLNGITRCIEKTEATFEAEKGKKMLVGVLSDVTEREKSKILLKNRADQLKEANLILNNIMLQIPVGFFIKDIDDGNKYIIANKRFAEIHKCDPNDIVGFTIKNVVPPEYINAFEKANRDTIAANGDVNHSTMRIEINGEQVVLDVTEKLVKAVNGHRLIIAIVDDISEKEKYQTELKLAKVRAEESDKLKSTFLANMSHEIRTPLNAIVGFSTLLEDATDEDRKTYIDIIKTNNEMLLRLIGDILDLSRVDAGSIVFKNEKFDMTQNFNEVYLYYHHKLCNSGIEFICDSPYKHCFIVSDGERIKQVEINFLTNACKYTAKGHIKMGYSYVEGGLRVYVEDTGPGIAPDKKDKVFDRFEKLNSFVQGAGLGLAISEAIVKALNGKIGVESELGKGSTFWAWFPCEADIEK